MTNKAKMRLYAGEVWHKRWAPIVHSFRYSVFYLMIDVEDLAASNSQQGRPWCLSVDRFNFFSIYQSDYLNQGSTSLKHQISSALSDAGIDKTPARVMLLTMPRVLGYAFNPINIFYCLDGDGAVMAVLYEVNNTFGERHSYAFQFGDEQADEHRNILPHQADKNFHVSPFFPVEGNYGFKQSLPDNALSLTISYRDPKGNLLLSAALSGQQRPFNARQLMKLFAGMPFLTFKVSAAIHLQALRLWMKGLAFWHKPSPPQQAVTGPSSFKR